MKNIFKTIALGAILSMTIFTTAFAAEETYLDHDKANNLFGAGRYIEMTGDALDACGAGYDIKLSNSIVEGTSAVAGYNVTVEDTSIGGTLFAAGYNIDVRNSDIANNIMATGCYVNVGDDVSAKNLTASAQTVTFDGVADYATLAGEKVTINGTVNENISIEADEVVIGENAKILGDLTVKAPNEPESVSGHVDGKYSFEQVIVEEPEDEAKAPAKNSFRDDIMRTVLGRFYWIAAMLIIGLLMLFMLDNDINSAKDTVISKPGVMLGLGFAALAGVPLACIILAITFIGLPSAGILLTFYVLAIVLSQTFTGLSVGRLVLSKFIKNAKVASLAGVVILVIVDVIPWIGAIASFAASIFTLGYIVLRIFNANSKKMDEVVDITTEAADVTTEAVVAEDVVVTDI